MANIQHFKVALMLKTPSELARETDLRSKTSDIVFAIEDFNKRYNLKKLNLYKVGTRSVWLILTIRNYDEERNYSTRELSYFSKRLYHDRNWSELSREESTLFTATRFEQISSDEATELILEGENKHRNEVEEINAVISDGEAIELLRSLFVVQNVGAAEKIQMRKRIITDIKKLLISAYE